MICTIGARARENRHVSLPGPSVAIQPDNVCLHHETQGAFLRRVVVVRVHLVISRRVESVRISCIGMVIVSAMLNKAVSYDITTM